MIGVKDDLEGGEDNKSGQSETTERKEEKDGWPR